MHKKKVEIGNLHLLKIKDLEQEISNLEYSLNREKELRTKAEGQLEGYRESMRSLEGRESTVYMENDWLRKTLRLIIVPQGREDALAKAEEERRKARDPLGF